MTAVENDLVVYQGWLQGVQKGHKVKINGKIYFAKEVNSRKTTYQFSGVTATYYVKKVAEKIVTPIVEKIKCKASSLISKLGLKRKQDSAPERPLALLGRNVEQLKRLSKQLKHPVQPLNLAGSQVLQKLA